LIWDIVLKPPPNNDLAYLFFFFLSRGKCSTLFGAFRARSILLFYPSILSVPHYLGDLKYAKSRFSANKNL
jgi:hypothetical protein